MILTSTSYDKLSQRAATRVISHLIPTHSCLLERKQPFILLYSIKLDYRLESYSGLSVVLAGEVHLFGPTKRALLFRPNKRVPLFGPNKREYLFLVYQQALRLLVLPGAYLYLVLPREYHSLVLLLECLTCLNKEWSSRLLWDARKESSSDLYIKANFL